MVPPRPSRFTATLLAILLLPLAVVAQEYVLVGWNDLGMHCSNKYFSKIAVLPPFNNVTAQLIVKSAYQSPQLVTSGYTIEYSIPNNTYSVGKTDFWTYAQQLFGLPSPLPPNIGLTGKGLTGTLDSGGASYFIAHGIPLTPYSDTDLVNESPFQLIHLVAKNSASGATLASTDVVIPVSNEVGCVQSGCHASENSILNEHESVSGFNRNGPVLCASCHASNALGTAGNAEAMPFSYRMHKTHAGVAGAKNSIATCYKCHPGPKTQCLRDIMGKNPVNPLVCQNCHGTMDSVANTILTGRKPWLNEPRCGNCHGSNYSEEPGKLYRQSTGHGGLFCSACHGSPHAIQPTVEANDNLQNIRLQGYAGALRKCSVCHEVTPNGPGPHGLIDSTAAAPPAKPFLAFPGDGSTGVTTSPTLHWQMPLGATACVIQLATDSLFAALVDNDSSLTQPTKQYAGLLPDQTYYWRVRATNASGTSDWSSSWSFSTTSGTTYAFSVSNGWNMVSLPALVVNASVSLLFPGSNALLYEFPPGGPSYVRRDSLAAGKGYWTRFTGSQFVSITGMPVQVETVSVAQGWNLIGAISAPALATAVSSEPPALTTSQFFGYSGRYYGADTLAPGRGYWVKSASAGKLIVAAAALSAGMTAGSRIRIFETSELPPVAPGEASSAVSDAGGDLPRQFALEQNYPNPFNPTTVVSFQVPVSSHLILKVYDLLGREVATLVNEKKEPGRYQVTWDAGNVPSGLYLYKLTAGSYVSVRKMLVLK
jgi:hypothetical protein